MMKQETLTPLTDAEAESFRQYAWNSEADTDGTMCQWARYTLRLLAERDRLRAALEHIQNVDDWRDDIEGKVAAETLLGDLPVEAVILEMSETAAAALGGGDG